MMWFSYFCFKNLTVSARFCAYAEWGASRKGCASGLEGQEQKDRVALLTDRL